MKHLLIIPFFFAAVSSFAQSAVKTPGCLDSLEIITTFWPHGDSAHNVFSIYFPCAPEQFEIAIFNRWGETVFTSEDYNFQWNGKTEKREELPEGAYFYKIEYTYLGEEKEIVGYVNLLF